MEHKVMSHTNSLCSNEVRARLDHPVIDSDGHLLELFPLIFDYLKQVAGPEITEKAWASLQRQNTNNWYDMNPDQRRYHNRFRPAFWAAPASNTLDRATAMLPKLMHERLSDMGVDYAVVYPTIGFLLLELPDDDIRRAICRAYNLMVADMFRGVEDRLTPAAIIPCHTPDEAIEELDYAITELGLKVPMFAILVKRPIEAVAECNSDLARYAFWVDPLALDSPYDYDPLWQKCMELEVPVTAHAVGQGIGMRRSISNYMYNHTGSFADAGHAFAKALFFGGVTHRFPDLKVAFLEAGVAWGATLVCELKERWEKRGHDAVQQFNPASIDVELLSTLFDQYGGPALGGKLRKADVVSVNAAQPDGVDDFAAANVNSVEDLLDRLVPNFYYGCEADDRMNAVAFNRELLPGGRKLNALFSSDFGHWDVTDMTKILVEAYEPVEDGLISSEDFSDFVFRNPVRLFTEMNPKFFQGTAVESEVENMLTAA